MAEKFATVTLVNNESDATITGEFVAESHNAWMVAVKGKVRSYMKEEWTSQANDPFSGLGAFSKLFGGVG